MLAIRMQRTGRKGRAHYRVIVQEARLTPTSGKVVAYLGSYDPHHKSVDLQKDKAAFFLEHGAQPSERVAQMLQKEGVKLPKWVKLSSDKSRAVRNPAKLRKNAPAEPVAEAKADDGEVTSEPVESKENVVAETAEEATQVAEIEPETSEAEPADAKPTETA